MNVSKISMAQPAAFQAKVTITAPEELLSKEDKEYFESLGPKIGKDSDTVTITLSQEPGNSESYNYSYKYNSIGGELENMHNSIRYNENGEIKEERLPKNYLNRIFTRLLNK